MEAEDPLSQLRDIHLPEPIAFWPPAPGWWVLLCVLLIGLVFLWRHAIAALIQRRKLSSVLDELDQAWLQYQDRAGDAAQGNQAGLDLLATINILLNRVALNHYPDKYIANLTGSAWLEFLDSCGHGHDFSQGAGQALADGIYRRQFDADAEAIYNLTRSWITRCYQEKSAEIRFLPFHRSAA